METLRPKIVKLAKMIGGVSGMTVKINGKTSLNCVGKNPRLSQAKSKNDKNIAGLLNCVEIGKITVMDLCDNFT